MLLLLYVNENKTPLLVFYFSNPDATSPAVFFFRMLYSLRMTKIFHFTTVMRHTARGHMQRGMRGYNNIKYQIFINR